jgi:hypothetical protein
MTQGINHRTPVFKQPAEDIDMFDTCLRAQNQAIYEGETKKAEQRTLRIFDASLKAQNRAIYTSEEKEADQETLRRRLMAQGQGLPHPNSNPEARSLKNRVQVPENKSKL